MQSKPQQIVDNHCSRPDVRVLNLLAAAWHRMLDPLLVAWQLAKSDGGLPEIMLLCLTSRQVGGKVSVTALDVFVCQLCQPRTQQIQWLTLRETHQAKQEFAVPLVRFRST
jgi:hypothetical protein